MVTAQQIKDARTKRNKGSGIVSNQVVTAETIAARRQAKAQAKAQEEAKKAATWQNVQNIVTPPHMTAPELKVYHSVMNNKIDEALNPKSEFEKKYSDIPSQKDFAEKSASAGTKPSFLYKNFKGSIFDLDLGQFANEDSTVNTVDYIKSRSDYADYSNYGGASGPFSSYALSTDKDRVKAVASMSDSDIGTYNYLFNTQGKFAAENYLRDYVKDFNERSVKKETENVAEFAKNHPVLGSAASVLGTVTKPEGMLYSIYKGSTGQEIDPNSEYFTGSRMQNTLRSTVKSGMNSTESFLYDTGMSTLDSLFASVTGPTAGAAMLAGGAGSDTALQVKQMGGSDKQALLSSLTSGTAEALFERISLGNLKSLKEVPIKTIKDVATNTVKSVFVNASEEAATELSNVITDYIIMGDLSDYQTRYQGYLSQGMSEGEAKQRASGDMAKRIGLAALGGGLSGGAMATVGQTINYATNGAANKSNQNIPLNSAAGIEENIPMNSSNSQTGVQNDFTDKNIQNTDNTLKSENTKPIDTTYVPVRWGNVEGATITGISKSEDGNVSVNIKSGGENVTDSISNVEFENPELKQVYSYAGEYKTNGAKAFISSYNGEVAIDTYKKGFDIYYDSGLSGQSVDNLPSSFAAIIPEEVRIKAYDAGLNDAKAVVDAENLRLSEIKMNLKTRKSGGVIINEASKKMDVNIRDGLNALGKAAGVKIQMSEALAGGQANGLYKDGTIYIALDSQNPYMDVAKHEITHAIQEFSPEKYQVYKNFVISEINKNDAKAYNDMVERLISRHAEIGMNLTRDEAQDEIVADATEMFFKDEEVINRLTQTDKNLAEKVIEIIRDIIKKIKSAIENVEPRSKAAIALNENLESAKKAEELWADALLNKTNKTTNEAVESHDEQRNSAETITAKYQLKDVDKAEYNRAIQENIKLKEINSLLSQQFEITKELKPNKKQVQAVAKDILKKTGSTYSAETLAENLENIWKFNSEHPDMMQADEVIEAINGMSIMILKKSKATDTTLVEENRQMIDDIKKTPLMISTKDAHDLASEGGLNNFRRRYFGKIKIVASNGISIDTFYQELAQKYPEYFDESITHPAEQLIKIAETLDFIRPIYYNPYGMSLEESARDLTNEIITSTYFDIKQAPATFADKKKAELDKIKTQYRQRVNELHNEYKKKYDSRLSEIKRYSDEKVMEIAEKYKTATEEQKKQYQEQIKKLKDNNLMKLKAQQQRFTERAEMARARRERSIEAGKYKGKIKSIAKDLSDLLLHPSDKKHIPQGLRGAVIQTLKMLDFETGRTGPNGEPTEVSNKLRLLQAAYAKLEKDEESGLGSFFDEDIVTDLDELATATENKRINQLSNEELQKVHDILKHIKFIVSRENKMFNEQIKETYEELGSRAITEIKFDASHRFKQLSVVANNSLLSNFADMMNKGLIKPYYFFKQIGGTIQKLYKNIRDGEDTYIKNINSAKEYAQNLMKKYGYNDWMSDKPSEFNAKGGSISLTTGEKLYIYMAYKREQGKSHILAGGVVPKDAKIVKKMIAKGINVSFSEERADAVSFSEHDMDNIKASLTEEQIGFAEEMGEYLSTVCADLGNEVAMKLSGYEKFTEKNYIPLNSSSNYLFTKAGVTEDVRIKRAGFTKSLTPRANNPIIAADFMDVWSKHVNDMAMYNSFVLPIEDFTRVWNFHEMDKKTGATASVKTTIQNVYGSRANHYIKKLLNDINGGIKADTSGSISKWFVSKMKTNAVMMNLSVALQQPTTIVRAMAVIDPKYFGKTVFSKRDYDELMKYSPQAVLKRFGYFDTNMGRNITDAIVEPEYDTPLDKIKAFFKDKDVRNDVFSWLPQKMDELAWTHMWNAVKAETLAETNLTEGTDQFHEHCKERFKEVIDRTQVMDSVFQRPEMMRSTSEFASMATAFMSEPLVTYNMLRDAVIEYKKTGNKSYVNRTIASLVGTVLFNSLLKSIVGAMRDDDKDKEFSEKYLENVIKNIADEPFSMIPIVNSIVSVFKGYDVIRPDMQLATDTYYAVKKTISDKYTTGQKIRALSEAAAAWVGVPLKNVNRDIESIWITGADALESIGVLEPLSDYEKLKLKYDITNPESTSASSAYYDLLYKAQKDGNKELYNQLYRDLINNGRKPSSIEAALSDRKREELFNQKKGEEYTGPLIIEAADAYDKQDEKAYENARKKLTDKGYSIKDVDSVINSFMKERAKENAPTPEEFVAAYKTGDESKWMPLFRKMRDAGWSQADIVKLIK